jgi:hypothetical protein
MMAPESKDFNLEQVYGIKDIAFNESTMLEK